MSPILIAIIIILILIIIFLIKLIAHLNENDSELYKAKDDYAYRDYIYKNVSIPAKPYIDQVFKMVDNINHMVEQYNTNYEQSRYDAMKSIYDTANKAEAKIKSCWNNANFNKDFSFYIGLHYASHMLGMAIKSEQIKIKETFVTYKEIRDKEGKIIDELKLKQEKYSSSRKAEIGREIAERCKKHKQISTLTGKIGEINSKYLERITQQNIETGKRRDYIANHFGNRGKRWKERIRMRALLNK